MDRQINNNKNEGDEEPQKESLGPASQNVIDVEKLALSTNASHQEPEKESSNGPSGSQIDGVHTQAEPEDLTNSLQKIPDLKVAIPACTQNQKMPTADLNSANTAAQDRATLEESAKQLEVELLQSQGLNESSSADELDKDTSDDQSTDDNDSLDPPDREDDDPEYVKRCPKPAKPAAPKKKAKINKKKSAPTGTIAKVKNLLKNSILTKANANTGDAQRSIPISDKKDKAKALAEYIVKLPEEDKAQAKKDAKALVDWSRRFSPSASIRNMNWRIKGLKTHLKHHQV
jgi:hypothetical protein